MRRFVAATPRNAVVRRAAGTFPCACGKAALRSCVDGALITSLGSNGGRSGGRGGGCHATNRRQDRRAATRPRARETSRRERRPSVVGAGDAERRLVVSLVSKTVATIAPDPSGPASPAGSAEATSIASVPRRQAERIAVTGCAVLMTGETGTGKGWLADWLHAHSPRAGRPFVPVNCGALPESIIDSHLFGHVRGAFSDAHRDHPGLVRSAEGGTLFLDEVGDLPVSAQLRLLRLLEEREVQPVGAVRPVPVDVRIIAATNRDLRGMVDAGTFREDLYYRLDVIHLHLRPLRERLEELPALVQELAVEAAARVGTTPLDFEPATIDALAEYDWHGNVREVRTVLERLHVFIEGRAVRPDDLTAIGQLTPRSAIRPSAGRVPGRAAGAPANGLAAGSAAGVGRSGSRSVGRPARASASASVAEGHGGSSVDRIRHAAARLAIDEAGGSISRAAKRLGVHRSTVHRWLKHDVQVA
ncbi:MAG: sigma 54-interacting transcriptional regulator [Phycisphaerales bacterium]